MTTKSRARNRADKTSASVQSVTLDGKRFVILPEDEYCRLTGEPPLPELPPPDAAGNYPAAEALQVSIARSIIRDRRRLGLSQAELARRAGVRPETLNRIERGTHAPSVATVEKLDRALAEAENRANPRRGRGKR
jgi:DNA-binding XRE family transcriptional regulator